MAKFLSESIISNIKQKVDSKVSQTTFDNTIGDIQTILDSI